MDISVVTNSNPAHGKHAGCSEDFSLYDLSNSKGSKTPSFDLYLHAVQRSHDGVLTKKLLVSPDWSVVTSQDGGFSSTHDDIAWCLTAFQHHLAVVQLHCKEGNI